MSNSFCVYQAAVAVVVAIETSNGARKALGDSIPLPDIRKTFPGAAV